jgi:hypothetical protein
VLLVEHDEQVSRDQRQDQAWDQEHVQDVEPGDDRGTRELAAEQEVRDVGADDRDALGDALGDPQARAGELVVGERVAEQALDHAQREQHDADQPVDLTGLAVRAGEEHPEHVRHDRDHEHVAAQWWICLISRPPRTSKEMFSVDS